MSRPILLAFALAVAAGSAPAHATSLGPYYEIVTLGFTDAAHTRSDGYQTGYAQYLNDAGLAAGFSERFSGADPSGTSAWVYDSAAASTTRIGLFDADHTRSDGFQESYVPLLTDSGFAAGASTRYAGSNWWGQDAWVYDATTGTQYSIILFSRPDGFSSSAVFFLGEDGLALGAYELFDADDNSLGFRAFAWAASEGAVDLGALVQGGLGAAGWSHLADAIRANGPGQIIGSGLLASGGALPYLLNPVPEPGTFLLVAFGLGGLALARRRAFAAPGIRGSSGAARLNPPLTVLPEIPRGVVTSTLPGRSIARLNVLCLSDSLSRETVV